DCHNRPAHSFQLAARAVDRALAAGELPAGLPYVKKAALELLADPDGKDLPAKLMRIYRAKYSDVCAEHSREIDAAGRTLEAIYNQNVFPDLRVTWGTYPNYLGHTDAPGCFRCHDDNHARADKKTITQDCSACHQMVAVDEPSPEILKTLGMDGRQP
ncbi:MAG TPA: hypothetical protein VHB50_12000, partial [Bryobacteraceae bacterium]|nr:hypothetical protein [Bryobacteraceae bacterium]